MKRLYKSLVLTETYYNGESPQQGIWSNLMVELNRITFDPNIMGGRACIRGMRVTVSLIVNLVANGMTIKEIIEDIPTWNQRISNRRSATLPG